MTVSFWRDKPVILRRRCAEETTPSSYMQTSVQHLRKTTEKTDQDYYPI